MMRHGRPWPGGMEFPIDDPYPNEARYTLLYGWRRCHSQMVWQAIQAVLGAVCANHILNLRRRDWQHDAADASNCQRLAGWYPVLAGK